MIGEDFGCSECYGTALSVHNEIARVKWDLDKKISRLNVDEIAGVAAEEVRISPNIIEKSTSPQELPSSKLGTYSESVQNSSSLPSRKRGSSASQSKHPTTSKKTACPEYTSSEDNTGESSSSDSDSDEDLEQNSCEDREVLDNGESEVFAHETKWLFGKTVSTDQFKNSAFPPRLHVQDPRSLTQLDYWKLFFPTENISYILMCINEKLQERREEVSEQEFYKFMGILYAMSQFILPSHRDYWATESCGIYPAPAFGSRFNMGLHRFEEILMCLSFNPDEKCNDTDKWGNVRPLVDMVTKKWFLVFSPGHKVTVNESMFAWYRKGNFEEGMPAVMKIKRKPKRVGCEIKTIADSASRIMIGMEINEGRDEMQKKKWQRDLGAGTATTLRLSEPWHGSGRIVVGDSWFASVKTAVELMKRGLYFMGIVKTANRDYPLKASQEKCPPDKGGFVSATAQVDAVDLIALSWRDRKVHSFISTCGTTNPGIPCCKKRYDSDGHCYLKQVVRPQLVQDYFEGAPAIDIHNHIQQDGLALEEVWRTQNWEHRMFASIFAIIETNAFLAFNFFAKSRMEEPVSHRDFTSALALQLINNDANNLISEPVLRPEVVSSDHTMVALSRNDTRKRVQKKCIICSRIHKKQVKASYYCRECGPRAVLCSPQTGRMCFAAHVLNGLPV